jgi:hypothetical protein
MSLISTLVNLVLLALCGYAPYPTSAARLTNYQAELALLALAKALGQPVPEKVSRHGDGFFRERESDVFQKPNIHI